MLTQNQIKYPVTINILMLKTGIDKLQLLFTFVYRYECKKISASICVGTISLN